MYIIVYLSVFCVGIEAINLYKKLINTEGS